MDNRELAFMKRYSIFHAIISVAILVIAHVIFKDLFVTLLLYAVALLFLPKLVELISLIGFYETDREYYSDGTVEYGSFIKFYGPLAVIRDLLLYVLGCTIPITILSFILPETIFLPLFGCALLFLIFHFVLSPLIDDIIWIFAKKDPSDRIAKVYIVIVTLIIVIGVVGTAAFAGISTKTCKDKLDLNGLLAQHFEEAGQENPYADIDMNTVEVDFSRLSTRAELNYDQPIVSASGISYPGSEMKFTYSVYSGEWTLSHDFTGDPDIVSTVVYVGENELEIGGYSGLAQIEVTIFSKTADGGSGVFKIIDKATSAEIYTTPFAFDGYVDAWGNVTFQFENPLNLGPWDVYEEDFRWEAIDHLYLYMNTAEFHMYLQK